MPGNTSGPRQKGESLHDLLDEKSLADEITKAIEGNDCPGDKEMQAYVRKELGEAERIEVKSHLIFCSRCRQRADQFEREPPPKADEAAPVLSGAGFGGLDLSPATSWIRRRTILALTTGTAVLLLAVVGGFLLIGGTRDFAFGGNIVHAEGSTELRRNQPFEYELRTPRPVYLIAITIDGSGRIDTQVPTGPKDGKYEHLGRIRFTPTASGEFDLYLVPCPGDEGFPGDLLSGLLKFMKTESSLNRENQRRGVEMALGVYRARFTHEVYRIRP
jgi:hypothetical protein